MCGAEPMMLIRPAHTADGNCHTSCSDKRVNCRRCRVERSIHIPLYQREAIAKAAKGGGGC